MVDCGGLENHCTERYQGFESLSLRMKTLKIGSKGDDVRLLQKKLGIIADGTFGNKTEKAVKEFQSAHSLTSDGIVGNATWKALGVQEFSKCIDSSVIYKPLSKHITRCNNRTIKYLAIHFTAGSNSKAGKAANNYNVFMSREASADFAVDDRDMVQFNPDIRNYYCWAVGDSLKKNKGGAYHGNATNKNTISIEICSTCSPSTSKAVNTPNHSGWSFTDATINNAVKLSKIIMKAYDIPIENVIRHYDITGKLCPGIPGWNNEVIYNTNGIKTLECSNSDKWNDFKKKLM